MLVMAESSNSKNVDARFSTFHEIHGHQFVVGHRTRTDSPGVTLAMLLLLYVNSTL